MRGLTRLEVKFLNDLRCLARESGPDGGFLERVYLTENGESQSCLLLAIRLPGAIELVYFEILIYGSRPVRYSLTAEAGESSRHSRALWNKLIGPLNLVEEKSGEWDGRMHLFYEVFFSNKELKLFGE